LDPGLVILTYTKGLFYLLIKGQWLQTDEVIIGALERIYLLDWTGLFGRNTYETRSGHWTLDAGHWTLDTGHWRLDTGHWAMDTGHWALDTGHKRVLHTHGLYAGFQYGTSRQADARYLGACPNIQHHWLSTEGAF